MNFELITEKPLWFIVFCLLLGAVYALLLYHKDKLTALSTSIKNCLMVLRFIVVSILAFLLLSPLLKSITRTVEKPLIIIAQDASQSITLGKDSGFYKTDFAKKLNNLQKQLSSNYDVRALNFGSETKPGFDFTYPQKQTDYSLLFENLTARFDNRNLGAVIIATDGIYNAGSSLLYASEKLKVPFYTIAMGDTTAKKDLILAKVKHNKTAFLGNTYPIEVLVEAKQCAGQNTTLEVLLDSNIIYTKEVKISSNNFNLNVPVYIDAKAKGVQHLKIKLSSIANELNEANNKTDVFVEVLERKLKVLILALSPHPDIRTLKDALSSSQNYDVALNYIDDFKGNISNYNLVILHQLPDTKHKNLLDQIYKSDVPQWTIIGMQTDVNALNGVQAGISVTASNGKTNSVQASIDKNFGLFTWSFALQESIENWPPLTIPFGVYRPTSECVIALNQRIGNVVSNQPLLLLSNLNKKNAILCGEGLWRWSLKDFAVNSSKSLADEFILKTVQYLATAENKSPFRVKHKNYVYDNEAIVIDAELVNEAGELVNSNDVLLEITGSGKTYNYTFSKTNLAYTLQAGLFPVGTYKLKSTATIGTKQYTYNGSLTVAPLQTELTSSIANHNMLFNVAQRSGGGMVFPQSLDSISSWIEGRPEITSTSYMHKELKDLVNEKWVFVLLITLLSTEWFVRKYAGAY